jgi:aspartate aminotransferase
MSTPGLAKRIQRLIPSPTLAVAQKAAILKRQGRDVIDLGIGEPDFDTPEPIKQAAIAALQAGLTKYTAVEGTLEIRQAIAHKLKRDNGLTYDLDQIIVSTGAKHSIYNLLHALLDQGDEVIIPAPYWVSYPAMVELTDATPILLKTTAATQYKIRPDQLERAMTPKTKLLILNSPSNPTGQIYTRAELIALAAVLKRHPAVLILSDDIYERVLWSKEPFYNIVMASPELYDRTFVINGVSKVYAMTGWRIGYTAGQASVIKAMQKLQSQSTSCACSIAQAASTAALNGAYDFVETMVQAFQERHTRILEWVDHIPGITVLPAQGAFYSFLDCTALIQKKQLTDDLQLAEALLNDTGVALVPGSAFGCDHHLRLSFATGLDVLEEAMRRIKQYTERL